MKMGLMTEKFLSDPEGIRDLGYHYKISNPNILIEKQSRKRNQRVICIIITKMYGVYHVG